MNLKLLYFSNNYLSLQWRKKQTITDANEENI